MASLLEYQAKSVLEKYGVKTPPAVLISKQSQIQKIRAGLFKGGFVVKAQVAAGGRGKAGGIEIVATAKEAQAAAKKLLGSKLVTGQTAGSAIEIKEVLIAQKIKIEKEYYMAALLNRKKGQPALLVSKFGGMEIEQIAKTQPDALLEIPIDLERGIPGYRLRALAAALEIPNQWANDFVAMGQKVARIYLECDCSLVEINPLALTPEGFVALDAKIVLDENALFRQKDGADWVDKNQKRLSALECKAKELGISYIPIGGEIGCLVNGAGLAMATMDLIASHGQTPANFLDVGGGANVEQVQGAFELLLRDQSLAAILVNIFGGIMRCDIIAQALVQANRRAPLRVPLVARLLGTNVQEARELLAEAKLSNVQVFEDLSDAVRTVCQYKNNSLGAQAHKGRV